MLMTNTQGEGEKAEEASTNHYLIKSKKRGNFTKTRFSYVYCITGWERIGQMLCKVDTSLSVLMTLRICLRELCCLFYCLGKGVLLIYVFIMAIFGDG